MCGSIGRGFSKGSGESFLSISARPVDGGGYVEDVPYAEVVEVDIGIRSPKGSQADLVLADSDHPGGFSGANDVLLQIL
jgi:hypothetical protein